MATSTKHMIPKGSYIGTNAFGVAKRVRREAVVEQDIVAEEPQWLLWETPFLLPMSPNDAASHKAGLCTLLIGSITSPFLSLWEDSEAATLDDPVEVTFEDRNIHFTLEELWYFDQHTGEVLARYSNLRHQQHWALHVEYEPEHVFEISAFADGLEVHRLNSVDSIHIDANKEVRLVVKSPYREPNVKITVNGSDIHDKWVCTNKLAGSYAYIDECTLTIHRPH